MRGCSVDRTVFHIGHDKLQPSLRECLDNLDTRNGRDNAERRASLVPDLSPSVKAASLERLPPSLMPPI
jgi:hypothetical protein